jgi:hypothetical protein
MPTGIGCRPIKPVPLRLPAPGTGPQRHLLTGHKVTAIHFDLRNALRLFVIRFVLGSVVHV